MGTQPGAELDAWLRDGGLVVASSDRAARAIQAEYHRRRRAEGLSAWPAPNILDWKTFARTEWEERNIAGRLLLNSAQELTLWSEIIHSEKNLPTAAHGIRTPPCFHGNGSARSALLLCAAVSSGILAS